MNTLVSMMLKAALAAAVFALGASGASVWAADAVDADAALALAKKSDCLKCHAVDKDKKGPSYKKIAAKYKGKPDGEEKAVKNMTVASKVKLDDGTEEDHKLVNSKDKAAIRNLALWILAQ